MDNSLQEVAVRYADRAFSYAVTFFLLWMFRDVLRDVKNALVDLGSSMKEFSTLLRERLK